MRSVLLLNGATVVQCIALVLLLVCSSGVDAGIKSPPIQILDNRDSVTSALMESSFVAYAIDHPELELDSEIVSTRKLFHNIFMKRHVADFFVVGQSPDSVDDDEELDVLRAANKDVESFPIAASAIQPVYNLPGTTIPLLLSRQSVVDIMLGDITNWSHPVLAALNPGVQLPNTSIIVVLGVESHAQTLAFAQALSKFDATFAGKVGGVRDRIDWPLAKYARYIINEDSHASVVIGTPYSFSYALSATAYTLNAQKALMINKAGQVVSSSETSLSATFLEMGAQPDSRSLQRWNADLSDAAGNECWPMAFVFAVYLPKSNTRSTCAARDEVITFWMWFLGSSVVRTIANALHIVIVPPILYSALELGSFLSTQLTCEGLPPKVDVTFDLIRVGGVDVSSIYADFMSISLDYFGSIDAEMDYTFSEEEDLKSVKKLQSGEIDLVYSVPSQLTVMHPQYLEGLARSIHDPEQVSDVLMDRDPNLKWTIRNELNPTDAPGMPLSTGELFHLPHSLFAIVPTHNIPAAVKDVYKNWPLVLDLDLLGRIFSTEIMYWNDDRIEALNPGLAQAFTYTNTSAAITLIVCCDAVDTGQPISNAFASILNSSSTVFHDATKWVLPIDWDVIEELAKSRSMPFVNVDFESQIESSVKHVLGAIGYKLASNEVADPLRDIAIRLTTKPANLPKATPIVTTVTASPDSLFACTNAVLPSLDPSYRLSNLIVTQANQQYMSQCWPFNVMTSIILPADYSGAACKKAEKTLKLASWMLTSPDLDGPSLNRCILRLYDVPGMTVLHKRGLNQISCEGETMLIQLPIVWTLSKAITAISWLLTAIGILAVAISIGLIVVYRNKSVLRSWSIPFQIVILIGLAMMFLALGLFGSIPTNGRCETLVWFLNIGFTLTFGPLFAKMWRIYKIFDRKVLKVVKISNEKLGAGIAVFVGFDLILNLVWLLYSPVRADPFSRNVDGRQHDYVSCTGTSEALPLLIVMVSGKFLMLVFGAYMGFATRNVNSTFNESKNVAWAIYNVFFSVAIIVPVLFFSGAVGDAFTILIVFLLFWVSAGTLILNFLSKFILLFTDDAAHSSQNSNSSEGAYVNQLEALLNFPNVQHIPKSSLDRYILNLEGQIRLAKEKHTQMLEEGTTHGAGKSQVGAASRSRHAGEKSQIGDRGNRSQIGDRGNRSQIGDRGNQSQIGDRGNQSQIGDRGNQSQSNTTTVLQTKTSTHKVTQVTQVTRQPSSAGSRNNSVNVTPNLAAAVGKPSSKKLNRISTPSYTMTGFDVHVDGHEPEVSQSVAGDMPVFHRSITPAFEEPSSAGGSRPFARGHFRSNSVELSAAPRTLNGRPPAAPSAILRKKSAQPEDVISAPRDGGNTPAASNSPTTATTPVMPPVSVHLDRLQSAPAATSSSTAAASSSLSENNKQDPNSDSPGAKDSGSSSSASPRENASSTPAPGEKND